MSKWQRKSDPVVQGPWRGCLRVRWRRSPRSPEKTGYLPGDQPELKEAYDAYERRCWNSGQSPDAPEVHFAGQVQHFLNSQGLDSRDPEEEVASAPVDLLTTATWVGTTIKSKGLFWTYCGPKTSGTTDHYLRTVRKIGALADTPMASLKLRDFTELFERWMACESCVSRAVATGHTPGDDIGWSSLVPRDGTSTWDRLICDDHHTLQSLSSYKSARMALAAIFNVAQKPLVIEEFGHRLVRYNPVPEERHLFHEVRFSSNPCEELRYGLTEDQVWLLTAASPELYRPIPFVAAFTLNRGGQELGGLRIEDFNLVKVGNRLVGAIRVHNFYKKVKGGGRIDSARGKTVSSKREVHVPEFIVRLLVEYLEKYRSTPSPDCPACQDGVRHWGGPLRDSSSNNPHVGCDFSADAPLWISPQRQRLDPVWYVKRVWHPACQRAGLTEETLGWKPQLEHSRSTGATLHLDHGTPVSEVVRLGGWENDKMLRKFYERQSPETRARYVAHWGDQPEAEPGDLSFLVRRQQQEIEKLLAICAANGIDPERPVEPVKVSFGRQSVWDDRQAVIDAICAVVRAGGTPASVLATLEVSTATKMYKLLAKACDRYSLPLLSTGKWLPDGRKTAQLAEWHEKVLAWAEENAA